MRRYIKRAASLLAVLLSCVIVRAQQVPDTLSTYDFGELYGSGSTVNQGIVGDTILTRAGYGTGFPVLRTWTRDSLQRYSVGSIPMQESVSPTGGRIIQVPIEAVPIRGIEPGISLVYNSQGDMGLVGYGWSIGGLSSITIGGKNRHYDGVTGPVSLRNDGQQRYYLDGVRLVDNPDTGQSSWAYYETATGYVKVFRRNIASRKIFDAHYPDGSKATFGLSTETDPVPSLPVVSKTDIKGNKVQYEYLKDGNNYYITRIQYGATSTTSALGEIRFFYTNIQDPIVKYMDGLALSQTLMLNRVECWYKGNMLREYNLTHTEIAGSPVLTEIDCKNGQGDELPPLQFAYDGISNNTLAVSSVDNGKLYSGLNNDDLVYVRGKLIPGSYDDGLLIYPKGDCNNGSYPSDQQILIVPRVVWPRPDTQVITAGTGFQTMQACDVDGDGVDEAVKVNITSIGSSSITVKLTIYRMRASGALETPETRTFTMDGVHNGSAKKRSWFFGDFLGNGKTQLVSIKHNIYQTTIQSVSLIDIESGSIISNQTDLEMSWNDDSFYSCLDYDGDGKTDLWLNPSYRLKIYSYDETQSSFVMTHQIGNVLSEHLQTAIFGDINADGLVDCISTPKLSDHTSYLGMMEVWAPAECPICEYPYPVRELYSEYCNGCNGNVKDWYHQNHVDYRCRICNSLLNADLSCPTHGLMQQVNLTETVGHDGGKKWRRMINTGTEFTQTVYDLGRIFKGDQSVLLDIDGDNLSDFVRLKDGVLYFHRNSHGTIGMIPDDSLSIGSHSHLITASISRPYGASGLFYDHAQKLYSVKVAPNLRTVRLLTHSQDSFGVCRNVYYDLLSESSSYDYSYQGTFPYCQALFPVMKVHSTRTLMSGNTVDSHNYTFKGPILNREGLGFRGFIRVENEDMLRSQTSYVLTDPESGCPTYSSSPAETVSMTWSKVTGRGITENFVNSQTVTDNTLTGVSVTSERTYDTYGNMTRDLSTFYPGGLTELTETVYKKSLTGSMYYTNKPERISVTKTRDEESSVSVHWLAYTNGLLTYDLETYSYQGTGGNISVQNWTYDTFGNVLTESLKPYNVTTPLTKTYTYDSTGEQMLTSTDAMGFTTTWSQFNDYGQPQQETDHKGRTTTYSYDTWGRQISTTLPDGTNSTDSLAWAGIGLFRKTSNASASPDKQVQYDALGREVRSGIKRFDGQWQWSDTQYDNLGRVSGASQPFRGQSATYWNTYTYDNYDRPISIQSASGQQKTWSYSGLTTTETSEGITSVKTADARGNLVSVTDGGGTITYTLRADDLPASVSVTGGGLTTFEYDNYGRRKTIVDPSAGTRRDSVVYAASGGYTVFHTTPNGSINRYYDRYGRLTHVNRVGEYHTYYTYDADGKLTGETSTNGASLSYTYDAYDRVTSILDKADATHSLQRNYTYGADGTVSTVMYTSSQSGVVTTENYTYANGWNTKIALPDGTKIWELTGENDLGQTTSGVTGTVTRTYGYNQYGYPTTRKMNGGTLQDATCSFEAATGNLLMRSDGVNNTSESFTYDALNRLSSCGTSQVTYLDNGNIQTKSGYGSITYGSGTNVYRPATVTLATNAQVPTAQQTISYTSSDRPSQITQGTASASFVYGCSDERVKMTVQENASTVLTRYYIDNCYELDEKVGSTTERLYLGGDAYSAPMVYVKEGNTGWTLYNLGRDYLGSVTHVATADGVLVAEYSYDPWGRMRNPETLTVYGPGQSPELFTGRGYTGHEHLPEFELINMNARLYDPYLGRFLSPDPFVQTPDFTQNFNRYTYALNNPLKYTDESGELFFTWKITSNGIRIGVNFGFWGFGLSYSWKEKRVGAYVEAGFNAGGTINGIGLNASFVTTLSVEFDKDFNYGFISTSATGEVTIGALKASTGVSYSVTRDFEKQNEDRQNWINHTIQYAAGISLPYDEFSGGISYDYQKNYDTGDVTHGFSVKLGYKGTNNGIKAGFKGGLKWENGHKPTFNGSFSLSLQSSREVPSKSEKNRANHDNPSIIRPMTPNNSSDLEIYDLVNLRHDVDERLVAWWLKSKK